MRPGIPAVDDGELRPGDLAWAAAMLTVALGIVACVAAVPVGLLAGRTAALSLVSVGAGLAVLSTVPATVFLWKWRRR